MKAEDIYTISPVVPVVVIDNVKDAVPLARALVAGGIKIIEVTLRTAVALEAIKNIADEVPQIAVGAGTVLNAQDFKNAVDAGAQFVFSPGISEELILSSKNSGITLIPGVATASEIMLALNHGITFSKLFPASIVGGVPVLKAYGSVFSDMIFCPTGGVNSENMHEYLSLQNVACIGGSFIASAKMVSEGRFDQITKLCSESLSKVL